MPTKDQDRLDNWIEIAEFLRVTIRSAQRYEKTGALPVHRVPGGGKVYALTDEVREWLARRGATIHANGSLDAPNNGSTGQIARDELFTTSIGRRLLRIPHCRQTGAALCLALLFAASFLYWRSQAQAVPRIVGSLRLTHTGLYKRGLATDGQRLYFLESEGNRSRLFQVSVAGGEPVEIPTPFQEIKNLIDISPDATRLLLAAIAKDELGMWVFQLPNGPAGKVRSITEASAAVWRPSQETIVFSEGKELYETDPYGRGSKRLATLLAISSPLVFSPDGSSLRFALEDGTASDRTLWEIVGKEPRRLPISVSPFWGGRWTPDGRYFVWITREGDRVTRLWARREGPGWIWHEDRAQRLTVASLSDFSCVLPSRDGRKLFVIAGGAGTPRLMSCNPSSGGFAPLYAGKSAQDVDFSRDGHWVAYVDLRSSCLWRMRADGTDRLQLTFPPMLAMLPHWAPNGRQIAFTAKTPEKPWAIYTIDNKGGSLRRLTFGDFQAGAPTWSPDGQSLVFGDILCEGSGMCAIRRLDIATGRVTALPGSQGMRTARWSPDGRYVAAIDPDGQRVMAYEQATGRWEELVHASIGDALSWSPDSQYIYFRQLEGSDAAVFRLHMRTHKLNKVVSLAGRPEIPAYISPWFGVAPDGSVLLVSDARDWDVYVLDWEAP